MIYLTADEHRQVVERLIALMSTVKSVRTHNAGMEYTSLMMCFALHSKGAAESILTLHQRYGDEWFPVTSGYLIVRSLFEVDVTAHYLTLDRASLSRRYILFEHVIEKNSLEAVKRHMASKDASWREAMELAYKHDYASREQAIEARYNEVRPEFEDKKGRRAKWWSGKSLYEMAKDVDHTEAYDIFYAELSSFAHVNVKLANKFLRPKGLLGGEGPGWSQRTGEVEVAFVFQYAATFLTCFLELFGKEFGLWTDSSVNACWDFPDGKNRDSEIRRR